VSGVRKRTRKLQGVGAKRKYRLNEAAAGNTACRAEALEAKAGTLKPVPTAHLFFSQVAHIVVKNHK